MTDTTQTSNQAIELNAADGGRRVLVTPGDEDRFVLSCGQAIEACRDRIGLKLWLDELDGLFVHVKEWAERHADQVRACYAAPRDGRVVFCIAPRADRFDLQLSDELTDLDLEIAQRFQVIPSEVLQVPGSPPERLEAFVDTQKATLLYGQRSGSPR